MSFDLKTEDKGKDDQNAESIRNQKLHLRIGALETNLTHRTK